MNKLLVVFSIAIILASCGGGGGGSPNTQTSDLTSNQWHLNNTGQTNFARYGGVSGADINIQGVTYTGKGVIVAVIDEGLEIAHEDLVDNVIPNGSRDFVENDNDPTRTHEGADDLGDHGTSVAGIIAALDNSIGPKGVAPNASLKGFNFLEKQIVANQLNSLGGVSYSTDVAIFNQSYGFRNTNDFRLNSAIEAQYRKGVTSLRSGKGALYVTSAGNGFKESGDIDCLDDRYTCQNANMDPENAIPYRIVVGATNANDMKSSYSTTGANIWVSAPGGEDGRIAPAILTTDQSGCARGYSRSSLSNPRNSFETNANSQNPTCSYTSVFGGTSSAAPVVSGVIALMLEANPSLTWRDVKHILANTSKQINATISDITSTINGITYVIEPKWFTNAAGYDFHNWYGFGRIDAARAVASATSYVNGSLGTFVDTGYITNSTSATIPNENATGVTSTINSTQNITLEAVQIDVNISHTASGELALELTSPSGTKSVVLNILNSFADSDDLNMVLVSNAFYRESSLGNWALRVIDGSSDYDNTSGGTLNSWKIRFYGH